MAGRNASDMRKLIKKAEAAGWIVDRTKKGHWRFTPPDTSIPAAITGGTPSDVRQWKNFLRDLRQRGLDV